MSLKNEVSVGVCVCVYRLQPSCSQGGDILLNFILIKV